MSISQKIVLIQYRKNNTLPYTANEKKLMNNVYVKSTGKDNVC
jgi:hypothetical protein